MPLADLPRIQQGATVDQINDYLIMLGRRLNDFLNHLDTLNVEELDAKVILANTITALQIAANAITTAKIAAGAVTADKITVTELSAITANLGTIIAGVINAVIINGATINITDDVTIGNNLTVGFGSNDRAIGLGGAVLKYTTFLDLFSPSEAQLRSAVSDVVLDGQLGNIIAKSSSGTIADVPTAINAAQSTANSALSGLSGKQNSFTGFTGSRTVITSVNFGTSTTTSKTLNFTNGVLTSIT